MLNDKNFSVRESSASVLKLMKHDITGDMKKQVGVSVI